jgi:hypothetical protein
MRHITRNLVPDGPHEEGRRRRQAGAGNEEQEKNNGCIKKPGQARRGEEQRASRDPGDGVSAIGPMVRAALAPAPSARRRSSQCITTAKKKKVDDDGHYFLSIYGGKDQYFPLICPSTGPGGPPAHSGATPRTDPGTVGRRAPGKTTRRRQEAREPSGPGHLSHAKKRPG